MKDSQSYAAWYETARGAWMGATEYALVKKLLNPARGNSLLDVGCGTGYFTQQFVNDGLQVTGLDPDPGMLDHARQAVVQAEFVQADVLDLPFESRHFDYVAAITSLCFVADPVAALNEMWRVTSRGLVLGLLNRHSLLYWQKRHSPGYAGARWDTAREVGQWFETLSPPCRTSRQASGIFLPAAGHFAQCVEHCLPSILPLGGFLAAVVFKNGPEEEGAIEK